MMTAYQLKMSILQIAMQGKLVERDLTESSVSELLNRISNEKKVLISQKRIKPEKNESVIFRGNDGKFYERIGKNTSCIQDEIPYDIPSHWEWQRLSAISYNHDSKRKPVSVSDREKLEKIYDYYGATGVIDRVDDYLFDGTYVLTGEDGGNFFTDRDNAFIVKGKFWPNNHVHVLQVINGFEEFFCYFLNSLNLGAMGLINGIAVPKLNQAHLNAILVPIPPFAEQKRIVAKIEELMPFVEQYAAASTKLNTLNASFPEMMKKSILQEAVQGKLVPQDPNDEPASLLLKRIADEKKRLIKEGKIKKQKPLPEITEDEIPFDIPESWEWVRLEQVAKSITDGDHQAPPKTTKGVPFLVISNVSSGNLDFANTRFVPDEYYNALSEDRKADGNDILFTVTGSYGIPVKVNTTNKFCFQRHIALIKPLMNTDYLTMVLGSPLVKKQCDVTATGTAQKTVGLSSLRNFVIPIPPLNEQKRILERLKEVKKTTAARSR